MDATQPQVRGTPREETEPADGYGAGFIEYNIRSSFRDLCRILGRSQARQVVAEIINAEFERKHNGCR